MSRPLTRVLLVAALVSLTPGLAPAQAQSRAERAADRAAERAQRAQERAERQEEQTRERAERHADWPPTTTKGAHILFGRDYTLSEGSTANEGIVVVGGDATIDGTAEDDILVIGGRLRIGPKAVIHGDVTTVGGELDRDPASRIDGDVNTSHIAFPDWSWGYWAWPDMGYRWWAGAALAFTIGRFALVLFLSVLLVTIAPNWVTSIAAHLTRAPGISTIVGFAAEIFFAPALALLAVALIITIVGIPLLAGIPVLVAVFALAWVAGYAAVAGMLGARLRGSDWFMRGLRPLDIVVGSVLLSSITVFGQALMIGPAWMTPFAILVRGTGWTVEYIAWTVGLGAALAAWVRSDGFDTGTIPPAVPPLPTPSPTAM